MATTNDHIVITRVEWDELKSLRATLAERERDNAWLKEQLEVEDSKRTLVESRAEQAEAKLAECKRSTEGLLDAVERLNAIIERKNRELADLHLIASVDPVELAAAEECATVAEEALRAIRGPTDSGPFIETYRAAGGGYEGLQAIAKAALSSLSPDTAHEQEEPE